MRSPRVTYHARVKRQGRRLPLKVLPFLILLLIKASLFLAPFAFCCLYMLEHGTPHILWEYEYYGSTEYPRITSCTYIGFEGTRTFPASECPFIDFFSRY